MWLRSTTGRPDGCNEKAGRNERLHVATFFAVSHSRNDSERNLMQRSARFNAARVYTSMIGIPADEPVDTRKGTRREP